MNVLKSVMLYQVKTSPYHLHGFISVALPITVRISITQMFRKRMTIISRMRRCCSSICTILRIMKKSITPAVTLLINLRIYLVISGKIPRIIRETFLYFRRLHNMLWRSLAQVRIMWFLNFI